MSTEIQSNVSVWLKLANHSRGPLLSLFPSDYEEVQKLTFILPARTIRDKYDKVTLIMVDRLELIKRLKDMFHFKTKEEITSDIKDMAHGSDSDSR